MTLDLTTKHEELLKTILRKYAPSIQVIVFGSRVNGTAKPHSDLDLALDAGNPIPIEILGNLREALDESGLPFRVDIVDLRNVDVNFRERILSGRNIVLKF